MSPMFIQIWRRVLERLDLGIEGWRQRVHSWGQVPAVEARRNGRTWSDDEVFRGLLLSILSNNTVWERVEKVRGELESMFFGFSLERYAKFEPDQVTTHLVPWFSQRRASSPNLSARLRDLIHASRKLVARAAQHGSADGYLTAVSERLDRDPKRLAMALSAGPEKLNGFGIPLAAEALKNIGYDVAKPDRHVNRAMAMFGMVEFRKWSKGHRSRFATPIPSRRELSRVLTQMEAWALAVGEPVALVDNAVWLLAARSGLHLTNGELHALAK